MTSHHCDTDVALIVKILREFTEVCVLPTC